MRMGKVDLSLAMTALNTGEGGESYGCYSWLLGWLAVDAGGWSICCPEEGELEKGKRDKGLSTRVLGIEGTGRSYDEACEVRKDIWAGWKAYKHLGRLTNSKGSDEAKAQDSTACKARWCD